MEESLDKLVTNLQTAAAGNLKALVLYGPAVSGEFLAKHSDLNVLCVVERAGAAELEKLHGTSQWWTRQGNPPPLVFTLDELRQSADIFAIELFDMKRSHRMLFGEDFLENFDVPMRLHRLQVERELRVGWLQLRQAVLAAPRKRKIHLSIMLSSITVFCGLFRHALIALDQQIPASSRAAIDAMASLTGGDSSGFRMVLDVRDGNRDKKSFDIEAVLQTYLEFVEIVTNEVDRRLEQQ